MTWENGEPITYLRTDNKRRVMEYLPATYVEPVSVCYLGRKRTLHIIALTLIDRTILRRVAGYSIAADGWCGKGTTAVRENDV